MVLNLQVPYAMVLVGTEIVPGRIIFLIVSINIINGVELPGFISHGVSRYGNSSWSNYISNYFNTHNKWC